MKTLSLNRNAVILKRNQMRSILGGVASAGCNENCASDNNCSGKCNQCVEYNNGYTRCGTGATGGRA